MSETAPGATSPFAPGPREFSCAQCGRRLRVQVPVQGPVKCPGCQHIQRVPGESIVAATSASPPSPSMSGTVPVVPRTSSDGATPVTSSGSVSSATLPAASPSMPRASTPSRGNDAGAPAMMRLQMSTDANRSVARTATRDLFERIIEQIGKLYVGQDELVLGTLVALFSGGHVLIESVPGLGKTLFVRTLGRVLGCQFGRIQFTADLMPSDITGAPIFDMKTQEFRFRPGPVFTQLLLADEINRSPAKTHAALLETMQEYRVTIDGTSHSLARPFLVLATQNPIESEGTYNLPEAQLDRFMFKLIASYPGEAEEAQILELHSRQVDINQRLEQEVQTVTNPDEIMAIVQANAQVRVDPRLIDYINKIVRSTRNWPYFHMGASPRAGLALIQGARTLAAFSGRDYAVPDDVTQIALPVLRHRVMLTAEADVEGHRMDDLLTDLIRSVEVPRI